RYACGGVEARVSSRRPPEHPTIDRAVPLDQKLGDPVDWCRDAFAPNWHGGTEAVRTPVVSVIMAVFDAAPWVGAAIQSLLPQTLTDFELIVIDDGSTDATAEVLAAFVDPRLRVERRARAGLTRSLNRALELARAPLVARLDADDVALPERLARQCAFLDVHR